MGDLQNRASFPTLATFTERIMKNPLFQHSNIMEADVQLNSKRLGETSIGSGSRRRWREIKEGKFMVERVQKNVGYLYS